MTVLQLPRPVLIRLYFCYKLFVTAVFRCRVQAISVGKKILISIWVYSFTVVTTLRIEPLDIGWVGGRGWDVKGNWANPEMGVCRPGGIDRSAGVCLALFWL